MPISGDSRANSPNRRSRVTATMMTARTSGPSVEAMLKCGLAGSLGSLGATNSPGAAGGTERGGRLNETVPPAAQMPVQVEAVRPVRVADPPDDQGQRADPEHVVRPDLGRLGDGDSVDLRAVRGASGRSRSPGGRRR